VKLQRTNFLTDDFAV